MGNIISVNVFCHDPSISASYQKRQFFTVERTSDDGYRFSNWYTEMPNEFRLCSEKFAEHAFEEVVDIYCKLKKGTFFSEKSSFKRSLDFQVLFDDGSEKKETHSIGNEYMEVVHLLYEYMCFDEFMLHQHTINPPESIASSYCYGLCPNLRISAVRKMCSQRGADFGVLWYELLSDVYDNGDTYWYPVFEVTDSGSRLFSESYDGGPIVKAELILDADGYITNAAEIPLMAALKKNQVRIVHGFSKGCWKKYADWELYQPLKEYSLS